MKYGRSEEEWDRLVSAGRVFLEEKARLGNLTSYTGMNAVLVRRTGLRAFNFDREDERAAMGHLLGLIVDETFPQTGVLPSALVKYLNENEPGPGFYELAKNLGLLPNSASREERDAFWSQQVRSVFRYYQERRRRRSGESQLLARATRRTLTKHRDTWFGRTFHPAHLRSFSNSQAD